MDIRYPATVEKQKDGNYLVQFVDLPDTFSEGQTREEALFNAAEVLSGMLAWRLDEAKDVPPPSQKVRGAHYIAPDAKTQAAMLLRLARGERTLSDLARALETSWPAARRPAPGGSNTLAFIEDARPCCRGAGKEAGVDGGMKSAQTE